MIAKSQTSTGGTQSYTIAKLPSPRLPPPTLLPPTTVPWSSSMPAADLQVAPPFTRVTSAAPAAPDVPAAPAAPAAVTCSRFTHASTTWTSLRVALQWMWWVGIDPLVYDVIEIFHVSSAQIQADPVDGVLRHSTPQKHETTLPIKDFAGGRGGKGERG